MKQCKRGHTGHIIKILVINKSGKLVSKNFCDYIVGTTGVESNKFKAILCGEIPIGQEFPKGMLSIGSFDV